AALTEEERRAPLELLDTGTVAGHHVYEVLARARSQLGDEQLRGRRRLRRVPGGYAGGKNHDLGAGQHDLAPGLPEATIVAYEDADRGVRRAKDREALAGGEVMRLVGHERAAVDLREVHLGEV